MLDDLALGGTAPEVVVDRVGRDRGAALQRNAVLAAVLEFFLAADLPGTHRGDHLQLRIQRGDGSLEADLVVALAGAAVGERVAAVLGGNLDSELSDQRPAQRGEQGVTAAVESVCLDRRQYEVLGELLAGVDHHRLNGAHRLRLVENRVVVLARLAEIDGQGHDLGVIGLLDPMQHHARVETARVEQHDTVDFFRAGLVGGDRTRKRIE